MLQIVEAGKRTLTRLVSQVIPARMGVRGIGLVGVLLFSNLVFGGGSELPSWPPNVIKAYNTFKIELARYHDKNRRALLSKAFHLKDTLNQSIIGQNHLAEALEARTVQYLENFGTRKDEPISLTIIGLPGTGKSASLKVLGSIGIPILRLDAQNFLPSDDASKVSARIYQILQQALNLRSKAEAPMILLIDELDKTAEVEGDHYITQPLIGVVNEILVDGKVAPPYGGDSLDLSNVFVVSAMNLSPGEIQRFSREVLGQEKNYWDFTEEDLAKLDEVLRTSSRSAPALAKILSSLFRDNTVTRLLPDSVITKPLYGDDFLQIVKLDVENAIRRTVGSNEKQLYVAATDSYDRFLRANTVFAPSGARMNVKKASMLTEQLINFGVRARDGDDRASLVRPRALLLDYDVASKSVRVRITPIKRIGSKTTPEKPFDLKVDYDPVTATFRAPKELVLDYEPREKSQRLAAEKPLTKREIRRQRFGTNSSVARGLAAQLNQVIFGQEDSTEILEKRMDAYLSTDRDPEKPNFEIFIGFTGTGKTEMVYQAAEILGLQVIKVNLQDFSDSSVNAGNQFAAKLFTRLREFRQRNPGAPYILLFEELDKLNEKTPTGAMVDRPVMAMLKDLLNEGHRQIQLENFGNYTTENLDIRDAMTIVTMNFPNELFKFSADPRLTTHQDVLKVYRDLAGSPVALKEALGLIFRDETVNRLMSSRMHLVRPLREQNYEQILWEQEKLVERERFEDPTGRNAAGIRLVLTSSYVRDYLLTQAVIPSEGGRQAAETMRKFIEEDVVRAINEIPRSSHFASSPIDLVLDFRPSSARKQARVLATAVLHKAKGSDEKLRLFEEKALLRFLPLRAFGKLEPERILITSHEFGHAYMSAMLGQRFESVVVVPPKPGIGGLVKYSDQDFSQSTGAMLISRIYSGLASRAMERIILSDNPKSQRSVLEISTGSGSDIDQVTQALWTLIYELGMDPQGGVLERSGLRDGNYNARSSFFAELPHEKVEEMAMLLRDIENQTVEFLLAAHSLDWYREKILDLCRAGAYSEAEFYQLIGFPYPGETRLGFGQPQKLYSSFEGDIVPLKQNFLKAARFQQGDTASTAAQNLERAMKAFEDYLLSRMHPKESICERNLKPDQSSD